MRVRAFLVVLFFTLFAGAASADESADYEARRSELIARITRVNQDRIAKAQAQSAIEQAELALSRASAARDQGDLEASHRALDIAEAATTLAERRVELLRETELVRVTSSRKRKADEEAARLRSQIARVKAAAENAEKRP